jgi:AraC family transcriptional regulator, regulatory protein of adaptative response / methylated-DNA-[protein]-cysteine methyltransferase
MDSVSITDRPETRKTEVQAMSSDVIRFAVGTSSLGSVLVGVSDKGVCAILLGRDPDGVARELRDRFPGAQLIAEGEKLGQLVGTVVDFVEAPALGLDLMLDLRGTAVQLRVWQALGEIPAGSTASYSDIARRIGAPQTALEVAQACASNAIAVAIPCHRVVRKNGALSGYRWGVWRKRALLQREAAALASTPRSAA